MPKREKPHYGPKDRPHGHLGSESTKKLAKEAVDKAKYGQYFSFLKAASVLPIIYAVIGFIVRAWYIGVVALIFAFIFHFIWSRNLAERSMIGFDKCDPKSAGYGWAKIFIGRILAMHVLILVSLIWAPKEPALLNWLFLPLGIVLYMIDLGITKKNIPDLALEQKKTSWAQDKMMRD